MFENRRIIIGTFTLTLVVALAMGWAAGPGARAQEGAQVSQIALGSGFTYQGQLTDDGEPASGPCDFRFRLYDAAAGGTQIGSTVEQNDVELSEGRFAVNLNFGATAFDGDAR
jgi:hypothetical protein